MMPMRDLRVAQVLFELRGRMSDGFRDLCEFAGWQMQSAKSGLRQKWPQ
jgi:hypothetical protein